MNNQPIIFSKDIITEDITPLVSVGNVLLTSRPSLNQLTNVSITTPADNQVLTYDAGGDFWYNADSQGGGGGGDGDYISYNITALPDISTTFLNEPREYFSLFATATYFNPKIINYNLSNGLTLNANGLITGLISTKKYEIEFSFYLATTATSNGLASMGLYNDIIGNEGSALLYYADYHFGGATFRNYTFPIVITGQTQINPVLKYGGTVFAYSTNSTTPFNATLQITEITGGGGGGATTLTELTDVAITTPAEGEALTYNATTDKWENSVIDTKTELSQLNDVVITTPTNGQYLQYDTSLIVPKWVNKTPEYVSYSINGLPIIANTWLNTPREYFSLFDTAIYNTTPTPIINYNFSNGLILNANGLITGISSNKYYDIEFSFYITVLSTGLGLFNIGLYNDVVGNGGSSLLLNTNYNFGASASRIYTFSAIITGNTQLNPVVKYNGTNFGYSANATDFPFNAVLKIKEL